MQHFSAGTSGAPPPPAPESLGRHSQSTFSALVTVFKGRITAHCETKVRAAGGGEPLTPEPPLAREPGQCEQLQAGNVGNRPHRGLSVACLASSTHPPPRTHPSHHALPAIY